jgi:uncharacterized protein (TIGR03435 family)
MPWERTKSRVARIGWIEITANAEQSVGDHDLMALLQTLLAERFRLALHREAKPIEA